MKQYKCPDCEARYETRDFLKAHIRSRHREAYTPKFDWINTLMPPMRPWADVMYEMGRSRGGMRIVPMEWPREEIDY